MIKVGDKVKFLNDTGGGVVTRITGNEAYVQDEDGFEVPTLLSNLVLDAGNNLYNKTSYSEEDDVEDEITEKKASTSITVQEKEKQSESFPIEIAEFAEHFELFLAIVLEVDSSKPDERQVGIYLLNEGNYFLYYVVGLDILKKRKNIAHGRLEPQMMAKIGSYSVQLLHEYSAMNIAILPFNTQSYVSVSAVEATIDWSTVNLMTPSSFQANEYFDEPAVILNIKELNEIQQKQEMLLKASKPAPKAEIATQKPVKEIEEVDLHIDKIVSPEQVGQLTSAQILEIQLDRFTFALESAIRAKTRRIVFIHGVGNGKLRYEIQKTLRRKYPHLDFQDASFAEYGYGATMVILRK